MYSRIDYDEVDPALGEYLEILRARLNDVVTWYVAASLSPWSGFPRTPAIAPSHLSTDRAFVVRAVARDRSAVIERNGWQVPGDRVIGRLLGYAPDESLADGAAEVATQGFFNADNEPPWDLWLAYVVELTGRSYLVSWIPERLVERVEAGMEVNPELCIFWLDELESALDLN